MESSSLKRLHEIHEQLDTDPKALLSDPETLDLVIQLAMEAGDTEFITGIEMLVVFDEIIRKTYYRDLSIEERKIFIVSLLQLLLIGDRMWVQFYSTAKQALLAEPSPMEVKRAVESVAGHCDSNPTLGAWFEIIDNYATSVHIGLTQQIDVTSGSDDAVINLALHVLDIEREQMARVESQKELQVRAQELRNTYWEGFAELGDAYRTMMQPLRAA